MKLRSGIYFALAVAGVLLAWYGGNELYFHYFILPRKYELLEPGKVNLVGLKLRGYRIVVSNGIARLEQGGSDGFGKPEDTPEGGGTGSVISMHGLLGTMRCDPAAASELATSMSGIKSEIEPLEAMIWSSEDLQAAIAGDNGKRRKLEADLCTGLEGGAVNSVNWLRINTGIWIRLSVPIHVATATGNRQVVASVLMPYQSRLAAYVTTEVQKRLHGGQLEPNEAMLRGIYQEATTRLNGAQREHVSESLASMTSETQLRRLAEPVERLIQGTSILATEKQISGASLSEADPPHGSGKVYSISLDVTQDSRDRLWQYTYGRTGGQLLLVSNDVAIAAPFIQHEIKYSTVTITGISDEDLAREALQFIQTQSKQK